ncbi:ShlB/FhaC/HecB family hemolysin secretion/activation protein, partial [Acinetobacter pittii]|nr:ShlB/FhaC/HecB family hemolysin secretion/activation protein [Acinetobacter pittii]
MLTKNFITSSLILFAGFHQYVYAIEDVSLPSQVLQDQRLKELNQQLQDQLAQQTPYENTKPLQDFKHLVVEESIAQPQLRQLLALRSQIDLDKQRQEP